MKSAHAILLFLLSASPLIAASKPLQERVVEHTCANGIKLLILERHFSPTVAIRMMFRTGSVDEVSGKTGLAHMFEHMMFKGTRTLGTKNFAAEAPLLKELSTLHEQLDKEKAKNEKADQPRISHLLDRIRQIEEKAAPLIKENELWELYTQEGASGLNAATSSDFTQYVVDLPSNKLELWALLDSDRLRNPVFRQFYQEREVVKEERRMRVDSNPDGKLYENFLATAYSAHPYAHPTIGWESDLDRLNMQDLEDFYRRHYTPERLTIVIVGDVKADAVIAMVDKYFGSWKASSQGVPWPISNEPPQTGPRRTEVKFDAQPRVFIGYHIPTYPHPDHAALYVLAQLLGSGTTSRLYKNLVEKKGVAASVSVGQDTPGERYASLFTIDAQTRFPRTVNDLEAAIHAEIDRLKNEPIESWELEKVRANLDISLLNILQTNGGMAGTLAYTQTIFGDWRYIQKIQEAINRITSEDVQRVAKTYLTRDNETTAVLVPLQKP